MSSTKRTSPTYLPAFNLGSGSGPAYRLQNDPEIKLVIDWLPEPTKTIVILIVFASMRVGEALALRWNDILSNRIVIDERLYDDDLDDPKTLHGNREVPFDQQGIIKKALAGIWAKTKFHKADHFVFATRNGTPTERSQCPTSSEGRGKDAEARERD